MANKLLIWGAIFLSCLIFGTAIGAVFYESNSLSNILGSIVFSPFSLLIRVLASLSSVFPSSGVPFWKIGNLVTILFTLSSGILTFGYYKTGKKYFAIGFGISFFILNLGNIYYFLAMMSV